jgi:hypothetical protein
MFDRRKYWAETRTISPAAAEVVFDLPLTRCIALPKVDADEICSQTYAIVARSWGGGPLDADAATAEGRSEILRALNRTTSFSIDVMGNIDRFVKLENTLLDTFSRAGLLAGIAGMQFPVDIRVVHPNPPENYLQRRDAVDYLHCDPWRGEPDDIVNVVLYCDVSDDTSQLELYAVDPADLPAFEAYVGDERESAVLLGGRPPVEFQHRPGQLILFDAYLPHRTRRLGHSVRVSLNFSMRRLNPYAVIDEKWDRPRQQWHKYWFVNESRQETFQGRYQEELHRIAAGESPTALAARKAALEKYMNVTF